jgi:hypothetical protein
MKSLGQPSFFRVVDLLLGKANPRLALASWGRDGIIWERERHSFSGAKHGMGIEIVTVTRDGRRGWRVMIVKEYWWAGAENKPIKSARWAKVVAGQRNDVLNWFRAQEASLDSELVRDVQKRSEAKDHIGDAEEEKLEE